MKSHLPPYLLSKRGILSLVVATAVFCELFILIFAPFQSRTWVNNDWQYLGWSSAMVGAAMLIVLGSRLIMQTYARRHHISYWGFALWIFVEMAVISLVYCLSLILGFPETAEAWGVNFMHLFNEVFTNLIFMLLIPYTFHYLLMELKAKRDIIRHLKGDIKAQEVLPDMFNFYDEKGELKLSVKPSMVYYVEAADNYVIIHYRNGSKMEKIIIRNTLKNIAWTFHDQGLLRCNRSYIVNIAKISMLRKVDGDAVLDFGEDKLPTIPLSKNYSKDVIEQLGVK